LADDFGAARGNFRFVVVETQRVHAFSKRLHGVSGVVAVKR
jgi:hypothetical protein